MGADEIVAEHRAAGREFGADSVRSFVREQGSGEPVVCLHGVPASSFLYRKVLPELAARDLRGIAFDLPGLGLADRPANYDYTWTGLGRFAGDAVDALGLDRFHLIVHDVGGPVGFELADAMPDRVRSMLVLDTIVDVDTFQRPWAMEPFAYSGVGEAWLAAINPYSFRALMYLLGVRDRNAITSDEIAAYVALLKRVDGGSAFLKIMRGFERTFAKGQLYRRVLGSGRFPVGLLWGSDDPALSVAEHGERVRAAIGAPAVPTVPAKHFLQEEQPAAVAAHAAALARQAPSS